MTEASVTLISPDGASRRFDSLADVLDAADRLDRPAHMKETDADRAVRDAAYSVTAAELRQFIERYEQLEAERKEIASQQKEVMAEAKGRGYDTKVIRRIIALRKRNQDDVAEEEAILDLYKSALGMV